MSLTALSSQVGDTITGLETIDSEFDIIKELIENCYDAHAKTITLSVSNFNVRVRDDGNGIPLRDRAKVGTFYNTSKSRSTREIPDILGHTLGLYGRSLASVAIVSKSVRLSTKTMEDRDGQSWSLGQSSSFETWNTHLSHGTEVFIEGIFESYRPRRLEMEAKCRNRLASVLEYLRFCAIRNVDVDLEMTFNGSLEFSFRSSEVSDRKDAAEKLFERRKVIFEIITYAENGYEVEVILPTSAPSESFNLFLNRQ